MTQFLFGAAAMLMGFGLMAVGVQLGRRFQKQTCGCDVDPFGSTDGGGCACGGSCGCN